MNSNCSNSLDLRNILEQVKKAFCYQKLYWPFTVWTNCSSDLKNFANSWPSASNLKHFSRSQEQFFLTVVGKNNFGNKIPFLYFNLKQKTVCTNNVGHAWLIEHMVSIQKIIHIVQNCNLESFLTYHKENVYIQTKVAHLLNPCVLTVLLSLFFNKLLCVCCFEFFMVPDNTSWRPFFMVCLHFAKN